jgi:tRNA uridine 5-carbamoylmethylation protein Kti12
MPCLILTGHPCSGKTTLAHSIRKQALQHPSGIIKSVVIVNEENACFHTNHSPQENSNNPQDSITAASLDKTSLYASALAEKKTRGALKAAFDRSVANASSSTLIIFDSLNYIKGFRYELYCLSKASQQAHAVIWVLNDFDIARQRWKMRCSSTEEPTDDVLFHELVQRYEPPDARNRWDCPCYQIDLRPLPSTTPSISVPEQAVSADEAARLDRQLLNRSVYNMHDLRDSLGGTDPPPVQVLPSSIENGDEVQSGAPVVAQPPSSTRVSRVNFKRKMAPSGNLKQPAAVPSEETPRKVFELDANALASLDLLSGNNNATETEKSLAPEETTEGNKNTRGKPASGRPVQPALVPAQPISIPLPDRIDSILDVFLGQVKPLQEGTSTRQHTATDANVLHTVESITQQVCSALASAASQLQGTEQDESGTDGTRTISFTTAQGHEVKIRRHGTTPSFYDTANLRNLRRQYVQWVSIHPPQDTTEIGIVDSFVGFLEAQQMSDMTTES